jgi:aspartate-semialdehyde dehydrogenase
MPSLQRDSKTVVIAGASSLLGAELKSLLEESRLADRHIRLLDEDLAAGTLTESGGEAAVIQPIEEGSFEHAQFVFFTGSPDFTLANLTAAVHDAAFVIDLSGASLELPSATRGLAWFPKLDSLLGRDFPKSERVFAIPSAPGTITALLTLALTQLGLQRLVVVHFRPVSDAGRPGIEELESQTGQLLSFQGVGRPVFDAQVAFNLLDRFGSKSAQKLSAARERINQEVSASIGAKAHVPAVQVLHAPVFYGAAFTAFAELLTQDPSAIAEACRDAGLATDAADSAPSNISAAGEDLIHLSAPDADPSKPGSWWFWGAADNIRLPAGNAVKLAEMLA